MPSTTSGARYLLVAVDASTIAPDARHSSTLALAASLAAPGDEIHLLSVLPARGSAGSSTLVALPPSPGLSTAAAAEALVEARLRASREDRIAASSWLHSSRAALLFACRWASGGGALAGRATLYLASAPGAPPFPVVFDDAPSSAVAASYGAERWEQEREAAATAARVAVEEAAAAAVEHGVDRSAIETAALLHEGGGGGGGGAGAGAGGGAAEALSEFAESVGAHVVVAGSRGLGAWKRAALALVGMGSVSAALLHSSKVPVVVVKSAEEEEVWGS